MSNVDAMLERLRPHIERLLQDDELTGFELTGRLIDADDGWKISRSARADPEVLRTLNARAAKERRLTAVR